MRRKLALPPASPKRLRRQRAVVGAMAARALMAYAGFGVALALLARPAWRAIEQGSNLTIALVAAGVIGAYAVAGGALCVSFVAQLRHWPPPGPPCAFNGARFAREWPWAAPKVLAQLGQAGLGHEPR
jgi:hypothetical protein